ncbi:CHAT domain-containing protein [Roseimicrobium gellanilyticum]|uniref:CHAT domain-containing protein n=1 Tax=Roseimicrobium gellanilyticum TaxID=748857 RepID=A0A366HMD2_9BACT|nr:CHAT domain-containing protein [Roseimicrobium gellanilyticum]RBP44308.1 CHAT domain-containing protein [Roseimicrobium gellanilyticum]
MMVLLLVVLTGAVQAVEEDEQPLLLKVPTEVPQPPQPPPAAQAKPLPPPAPKPLPVPADTPSPTSPSQFLQLPRQQQQFPIPEPGEVQSPRLPGQEITQEINALLADGKVGQAIAGAEAEVRRAVAVSADWQMELAALSALASARMASASVTPRELYSGEELLGRGLEILKHHPEVDAYWVAEIHGKLAWVAMNRQQFGVAGMHLLQAVHASLERPDRLSEQWELCRAFTSLCEFSGSLADLTLKEQFIKVLLKTVQSATVPDDLRMVTPMDLWAEHQETIRIKDYAGAASTRRAILDIIAKHSAVDERLPTQLLALADLLSLHLHQPKEAEEHYRLALEAELMLPGLNKRQAEIRDGLARLTGYQLEKAGEHLTHTEESWKIWKKVGSLNDLGCRQAQERLAGLLATRKHADRAEPLYTELLEWHRKQAPQAAASESAPVSMLLQERESVLQDACRFFVDVAERPQIALECYQELLELQGRQQEAGQPERMRTLVAMAGLLQKLGRSEEANRSITGVLQDLEKKAAQHPESFDATAARHMAQFHTVLGRGYSHDGADEASQEQGMRHFQMATALRRDLLRTSAGKDAAASEDRREVVWSLVDQARAFEHRGNVAAAEEHFRRALAFAGNKQGNPGWKDAAQALATFLAGERRHTESVAVLRKILEGQPEGEALEARQQRRVVLQELYRELDRAGDDEGALVVLAQMDRNSWNTPWRVEEEEFVAIREARIKLRKRHMEAAWAQMLETLEKRRERQDEAGLLELLEEMIPVAILQKDGVSTEQFMEERMGLLRKQEAGAGPLQATLLEHAGLWLFSGDSQRALEAIQASQALGPVAQSTTTPQTRAILASGAMLEMFTLAQRKDMTGARAACENLVRYTAGTPHEQMVKEFQAKLATTPDAMEPFQNVALLAVLHDRAAAGRRLLECAVALCEERHGSTAAASILLREQLGQLCLRLGEHGAAIAHYEIAWSSLKDSAAMAVQARKGVVLQNLITLRARSGDWPSAEKHAREMLDLITAVAGAQVVGTSQLHLQLAECAGRRGDREVAATRMLEALRVLELGMADVMHSGTEQEVLHYAAQRRSAFDLVARYGSAEAIAGALVRQKGVLLDSLLQDSQMAPASGDLSAQPLLGRVEVARSALSTMARNAAAITLETPYADAQALLQDLEKRREDMADAESSFMTLLGGTNWKRRALSTSLADVREGMPEGAVLLDFYRHREPGGLEYFSVSILPKKGVVKQVRLAEAGLVEELIRLYHQVIQHHTNEATAAQVLAALGQVVVGQALANLEHPPAMLILCPDDALQMVSFPTLLLEPDGRFLSELMPLRQVTAARDLALLPPAGPPATPIEARAGTNADAGSLEKKLRDEVKASPVLQVRAPLFFLPSASQREEVMGDAGHAGNPSWRSGLLLSSADDTLTAWKESLRVAASAGESDASTEPEVEDGIFAASEIATLDLRKTKLVTVPACLSRVDLLQPESGADDLLALQRAFTLAGAEQSLLALWPVEDKAATAEFMSDLQKKLQASGVMEQGSAGEVDVAVLLQEVQREWLVRLRGEKDGGLVKAVSTAGPFVMMQGVRARR